MAPKGTIEDIRKMDIFDEALTTYAKADYQCPADGPEAAAATTIATATLVGADVIRRTILAAHDSILHAIKSQPHDTRP